MALSVCISLMFIRKLQRAGRQLVADQARAIQVDAINLDGHLPLE